MIDAPTPTFTQKNGAVLTRIDSRRPHYTYNAQGGIETVTHQASGSSQVTTIAANIDYNAAGQLTTLALGNGVTTDYTYHQQTLRLQRLISQGPGGALQDFEYGFDAVGNVTQITDRVHTATQSFQYDPLNRLTQASGAYGTLAYAYDPIGNMTSKEGAAMTYGAGPAGPHAVTAVSGGAAPVTALNYDANGNLVNKQAAATLQSQTFSYDAENRLTEVQQPLQGTIPVTFKPGWNFFALPVIPANLSIASILPNFSASFEQVAKHDPATGNFTHYLGNASFDQFSALEYGVGYQVYCKSATPVTVTLTGTLPSTPITKAVPVGWNLLGSLSLEAGTVSDAFRGVDVEAVNAYDAASGSLTTATHAQPATAYYVKARTASTWAPALPRDPLTRFVYDGDGGRVKTITSAGTTKFLGPSYELAPDGAKTKYIFAGSQRLAALTTTAGQASLPYDPSKTRWYAKLEAGANAVLDWFFGPTAEAAVLPGWAFYHGDHLGSTHLVTNSAGAQAELSEYTPYGSQSRAEGATQAPQQFTGQRRDSSIGLYFYNARYYDPQLGRFVSPDTIVQDPSDPQSLNRYAYARNNPVNYIDPSGHFFFAIFAIIAAIAKAAVATVAAVAAVAAQAVVTAATVVVNSVILPAIQQAATIAINTFSAANIGNIVQGATIGGIRGGITAAANGQSVGRGIGRGAFAGAVTGGIAGGVNVTFGTDLPTAMLARYAGDAAGASGGQSSQDRGPQSQAQTVLNGYLQESVVPGPFGQPLSEWGPNGPTEWGNPLKYTEAAGGAWRWSERGLVGLAGTMAVAAAGVGAAEFFIFGNEPIVGGYRGGEFFFQAGKNRFFRINPFGDPKSQNPYARRPHYHRRPGIEKHRPWERGW